MKPPSTALLRAFSSIWRLEVTPPKLRGSQRATFSVTQHLQKRDKAAKPDMRITQIRYHLQHPLTPRPLRFSRTRALRHWTIHRAWQLHQAKLRRARELELERQYNSMASACEALRLIDNYGLTAEDRARLGEPLDEGNAKETGKLFRTAMMKTGVWDGVPIEYAKIQTDSPPKAGWNHEWTR